jgi:hypothetical protein
MMRNMHNLRKLLVAVIAAAALAVPASAFAAESAKDAYNSPAGTVQDEVAGAEQGGSNGVEATQQTSSSSLPFTGMDLALLLGAGVVFVAAGLGMRRLARQPDLA